MISFRKKMYICLKIVMTKMITAKDLYDIIEKRLLMRPKSLSLGATFRYK